MATLGYIEDDGDGPCCKATWRISKGCAYRCTLEPGHAGDEHIATGPPEEHGPEENRGKLPIYAKWRTVGEVSS